MIIDSITGFFDNVKQKVNNPFFGTLIGVWLVRNWLLVYTLFNFDKECNLIDKVNFIKGYYYDKNVWNEVGQNIWITFVIIILGYILIIASRSLSIFVEHNITPIINKKLSSNLVVNKEVSDALAESLNKKTDDLFKERKINNDLELVIVEQRGKIDTARQNYTQKVKEITDLKKEVARLKATLEQDQKEIEQREKMILSKDEAISNLKGLYATLESRWSAKTQLLNMCNIDFEVSDAFIKLIDSEVVTTNDFIKVAQVIVSNSSRENYEPKEILELEKLGLIQFKNATLSDFGSPNLELTELGEYVHKHFTELRRVLDGWPF